MEVSNEKIVSSNSNIRKPDQKKTSEFKNKIKNRKIVDIKRRAKNIIIELDDESIILIHLKMTGQLVYSPSLVGRGLGGGAKNIIGGHPILDSYKNNLPNKHTHIIFKLDNGTLYYNDTRQFGYVLYYKSMDTAIEKKHFHKMGLEPLDKNFTLEYFKEKILLKNKNLKSVLLDQDVVVGCGNIYADEVCFASSVMPSRIANSLSANEIERVYNNIKDILSLAIKHGGSSISDYLLSDGSRGNYARLHKVYGKAGLACLTCKNILDKGIIAGRTTVFCNTCQK